MAGAGASDNFVGQSSRGESKEMACSKVAAQASLFVKKLGRLKSYNVIEALTCY